MSPEDALALKYWLVLYKLGFVCVWAGVVAEAAEMIWEGWDSAKRKRKGEKPWNDFHENPETPKFAYILERMGWLILVIGLGLEEFAHDEMDAVHEHMTWAQMAALGNANRLAGAAHLRAALTESNSLVLRSNIVALAHAFDLSTNALAEARARIAEVEYLTYPRLLLTDRQLWVFPPSNDRIALSVTYEIAENDPTEPKRVAEMLSSELRRAWGLTSGLGGEVVYKQPGISLFIKLPQTDPKYTNNSQLRDIPGI